MANDYYGSHDDDGYDIWGNEVKPDREESPHHIHWVDVEKNGVKTRVQMVHGPNGIVGQRDPRAADVSHLKCHDCGGSVFVRWFLAGELLGYSCDDRGCWPVSVQTKAG